jgi:GNAT superfamily N-acetyltransferase
MVDIRGLQTDEIPLLKEFAPPEWNTDLSAFFSFHFGQPYFYPIVAHLDGVVVGCGDGLLHGNVGWLGNIIVLAEYRGRGIGKALTKHLMDAFQSKGIRRQVLIATRMGEPVYTKLGFQVSSHYIFYKHENLPAASATTGIRSLAGQDFKAVFTIDRQVSGEDRQSFLKHFFEGGWVHLSSTGEVDGYYLPKLGSGLVIAANDDAGLALLQYRLSQGLRVAVVPQENRTAADFFASKGFLEAQRAPRMVYGGDVEWQSERVYSRGSGYCG